MCRASSAARMMFVMVTIANSTAARLPKPVGRFIFLAMPRRGERSGQVLNQQRAQFWRYFALSRVPHSASAWPRIR